MPGLGAKPVIDIMVTVDDPEDEGVFLAALEGVGYELRVREWLYVLAGELRLIIADHDITMQPGEVAEFDPPVPHWFGPVGDRPVEILSILGREGERIHVRAAPTRTSAMG